jgi:2-polyprenyl-6-methoxyphenol hydroxylase-like FAD-dependent oxidoreductase
LYKKSEFKNEFRRAKEIKKAMTKPTVAIIGGGIGGLTLAVALQKLNITVRLYENTPILKPVGAGLGLAGNAIHALQALGIDQPIIKKGNILDRLEIVDQKGKILSVANPSASITSSQIHNFAIHRADLHQALLGMLDQASLFLNKRCIDFNQHQDGVEIIFEDGTSESADFVVACDGINSVFRKKLLPTSLPRYAGYTCWRAVIPQDNLSKERHVGFETWGKGKRFGVTPLSENRLYWYACINAATEKSLLQHYTIYDLKNEFQDFHNPIPEILSATPNEHLIWGDIYDIAPIPKFAFNNIVLLGDAAHATTPNMGQGACMAIEDAVTLRNAFMQHGITVDAGKTYEQKRLKRTQKIIEQSRLIGKIAHISNPMAIRARNIFMRLTPQSVSNKQLKFLYSVDF